MDPASKKNLKAKAHMLKPVVIVGQAGLTGAVLAEIEIALDSHELIKVKIRAERDGRAMITEEICMSTKAELIQSIGQIAVIYRKNPKPPVKAKLKRKPTPKTKMKSTPARHKPRK